MRTLTGNEKSGLELIAKAELSFSLDFSDSSFVFYFLILVKPTRETSSALARLSDPVGGGNYISFSKSPTVVRDRADRRRAVQPSTA
jgi:hypothetical protein